MKNVVAEKKILPPRHRPAAGGAELDGRSLRTTDRGNKNECTRKTADAHSSCVPRCRQVDGKHAGACAPVERDWTSRRSRQCLTSVPYPQGDCGAEYSRRQSPSPSRNSRGHAARHGALIPRAEASCTRAREKKKSLPERSGAAKLWASSGWARSAQEVARGHARSHGDRIGMIRSYGEHREGNRHQHGPLEDIYAAADILTHATSD